MPDHAGIDRTRVNGETKACRCGLRNQQRSRGPASGVVGIGHTVTDEFVNKVLQEDVLSLQEVSWTYLKRLGRSRRLDLARWEHGPKTRGE